MHLKLFADIWHKKYGLLIFHKKKCCISVLKPWDIFSKKNIGGNFEFFLCLMGVHTLYYKFF